MFMHALIVDFLFVVLGINPLYPGLQTLEATDMLLHKHTLLTYSHVTNWQVGCVSDVQLSQAGLPQQQLLLYDKASPSFFRSGVLRFC